MHVKYRPIETWNREDDVKYIAKNFLYTVYYSIILFFIFIDYFAHFTLQ